MEYERRGKDLVIYEDNMELIRIAYEEIYSMFREEIEQDIFESGIWRDWCEDWCIGRWR